LELPWKENFTNISAIPEGQYRANIRYDKLDKLGHWRLELLNVPGRTGIQIHIGNTVSDATGCILLGTNIDRSLCDVVGSEAACKNLKEAFYASGQPSHLVVIVRDAGADMKIAERKDSHSWYVRPGAVGRGDGRDWNNAWSLSAIAWDSINPGDTIYVAGGTYGHLILAKSGTPCRQITLMRASAKSSACTTAAGWSSWLDTQINLASFTITASYITLNGLTTNGIRSASGAVASSSVGVTNAWIEFSGVPSDNRCGLRVNSYGNNPVTNLTIDHCNFHDLADGIQVYNATGLTVQYCEFHPIQNGFDRHGNVAYMTGTLINSIWRFNRIHNNNACGILYGYGAICVSNVFFGNIFYGDSGTQYAIWATDYSGPMNSIYIYNNTFCNEGDSVVLACPVSVGLIENNIYWSSRQPTGEALQHISHDYNFSDGKISGEAHSISGGSNPFVNLSGNDFHIISTTGAAYPRDKGVALSTLFQKDIDGNSRGGDGLWDIGAYELSNINTNPVAAAPPAMHNFGPVAARESFWSLSARQSQVVTIHYTSEWPFLTGP
jgi:hypothetical protein